MRSAVVLLALFAAASAAAVDPHKEADEGYLLGQRDILRLFTKIQQPVIIPEHEEMLKTFTWESVKDKVKDPHTLEHFMEWYKHGRFLPRNEDFTLTYKPHIWQVKMIFNVLKSAIDFEAFYKMAVWMRYHLNERMFSFVLRTVVHHREETKDMMMPPSYEVFPQYFVTSDVMQEAYDAHLRGLGTKEDDPYIIYANYTCSDEIYSSESSLSYFREDVGLNSFLENTHYSLPPWIKSTDSVWPFMEYRGHIMYYWLRQLLARYGAERFANGLPPVEPVVWWEPVEEGYDPKIRHQSGHDFPARPAGLMPKSTSHLSMEDVMDWEGRIRSDAALSIYFGEKVQIYNLTAENSMNKLMSIIQGSEISANKKYYGTVYMGLFTIFGRMMDPHNKYAMAPSVLQEIDTKARDPLYYRILKRMWMILDRYKNTLPPYRNDDVMIPGLKIQNLKADKLMTFFDDFDIHVDNAIDVQKIEDARKVNVIARQHRLNHKPFSFSMKVSSDKERTALVRVFMGPRVHWSNRHYMEDESRHQFFMLDVFQTKLIPGENTVVRNSREMFFVGEEPLGLRQMFHKVEAALAGKEKLTAGEDRRRYIGFPHRLQLPRGWRQGLPMTLFAIVTDTRAETLWPGQIINDGHDQFFPLDRQIFLSELRSIPNAHFEDVYIFHRSTEDLVLPEQ